MDFKNNLNGFLAEYFPFFDFYHFHNFFLFLEDNFLYFPKCSGSQCFHNFVNAMVSFRNTWNFRLCHLNHVDFMNKILFFEDRMSLFIMFWMLNGGKRCLVNINLTDISISFEEPSPGSPFLSIFWQRK